ncbi:MAG TPA: DUF423 domain-containing protein [Chitinophagaceae bacterium]|nr:DUF423 domain-containing protein [Chitinophagaceae bacterium]
MNRSFIKIAAFLGALSVALGAFGAHTLKQYITPEVLNTYETAIRYQFFHALALLAVGILFKDYPNKWVSYSGKLFIGGIILFSGSLYTLVFFKIASIYQFNWVGALTPIGGVAFITGWICLLIGVKKN